MQDQAVRMVHAAFATTVFTTMPTSTPVSIGWPTWLAYIEAHLARRTYT